MQTVSNIFQVELGVLKPSLAASFSRKSQEIHFTIIQVINSCNFCVSLNQITLSSVPIDKFLKKTLKKRIFTFQFPRQKHNISPDSLLLIPCCFS